MNLLLLLWYPFGWYNALFGRPDDYARYTQRYVEEYMPHKCVSWIFEINNQ